MVAGSTVRFPGASNGDMGEFQQSNVSTRMYKIFGQSPTKKCPMKENEKNSEF